MTARRDAAQLGCFAGFLVTWLSVAAVSPTVVCGQNVTPEPVSSAAPLQFDVVSIKPSKSVGVASSIMAVQDGYVITGDIRFLAGYAYGIRTELVSGEPGWADGALYEISAKVTGSDVEAFRRLGSQQRSLMTRSILTDRFKLTAHIETKELPLYELVVAKGGPKLKQARPEDEDNQVAKEPNGAVDAGSMSIRPGMFESQAMGLSGLVEALSHELRRTVVDKTGLTGTYDIKIRFTPDNGPLPWLNGEPDTSAPSIFTALEEQLGLKLNSAKGPVQTLVVDHVEQPTEN